MYKVFTDYIGCPIAITTVFIDYNKAMSFANLAIDGENVEEVSIWTTNEGCIYKKDKIKDSRDKGQ